MLYLKSETVIVIKTERGQKYLQGSLNIAHSGFFCNLFMYKFMLILSTESSNFHVIWGALVIIHTNFDRIQISCHDASKFEKKMETLPFLYLCEQNGKVYETNYNIQ